MTEGAQRVVAYQDLSGLVVPPVPRSPVVTWCCRWLRCSGEVFEMTGVSRVRMALDLVTLKEATGGLHANLGLTFELEGAIKPACAAEMLFRNYVGVSDGPQRMTT